MLKRILVLYDASEPAERAFQFALELAKHFHATLGVLAFESPSWPPTAVEMAGFLESTAERLERGLAGLREGAQACGIRLNTRVITRCPAKRIIREATELNADLIIVGRGDGNPIKRWLSRSVSRRVSNNAPCNVVIVR